MKNQTVRELSLLTLGLAASVLVAGAVLESRNLPLEVSVACGSVEVSSNRLTISHCDGSKWVDTNLSGEIKVVNSEGVVQGVLTGRHGEGPIEVR